LIDDAAGRTLASVKEGEVKAGAKTSPLAIAEEAGKLLASKAKKITGVVFDRGPYKYHGRVKAAAEGARAGGLEF